MRLYVVGGSEVRAVAGFGDRQRLTVEASDFQMSHRAAVNFPVRWGPIWGIADWEGKALPIERVGSDSRRSCRHRNSRTAISLRTSKRAGSLLARSIHWTEPNRFRARTC